MNNFLYPMSRSITATLKEYERLNNSVKIDWGLKEWDDYVIPFIPGLIYGVLARTSNGKTSLLTHIARHVARETKNNNTCVVYATWETLVEQFITSFVSSISSLGIQGIYGKETINIEKQKKVLMNSLGDNVVIIGRSMSTPVEERFTIDKLEKSLKQMIKSGMNPGILLVDYLQRIEGNPQLTRTQQVTEHIIFLRNLSQRYKIPVVFAVQGGRTIDEKNGVRWPSLSDVQWASAVEQEADVLIGITRPIQYLEEGEIIKQKKKNKIVEYTVNQGLMGLNVIKQRFGPVGSKFFFNFDPIKIEFTPINTQVASAPPAEIIEDFDFGF